MEVKNIIRIAIVDDEHDVCSRLIKMLTDLNLNIEIVNSYENGFDAYEDLQSKQIDILITDIRIPYIDGFELAQRVKSEINPLCKFIIISGYDEFDYAKQAIDLQVIGYLCKPINQAELAIVMNKALVKIAEDNNNVLVSEKLTETSNKYRLNILESDFRRLLEYNSKTSEIINKIKNSGINLDKNITMALFEFDKYYSYNQIDLAYIFLQDQLHNKDNLFLFERDSYFVLFNYSPPPLNLINTLQILIKSLKQVLNMSMSVGISPVENHNFRNAYLQCKRILDLRQEDEQILTINKTNKIQSDFIDSKFFKQLSYLVKFQEKKEIMDFLKNGIHEASTKSHLAFSLFVTETLNTIILSSNYEFNDETLVINSDIYQEISSLKNINRTLDYLEKLIITVKSLNAKSLVGMQESNYQYLISYINCHYSDIDLSLETLGNQVALSPSYIAYLLKTFKNTTFVKLITELRIEEAKELILSKKYKISEISNMVGYQDPYYFSYCFKKYCGISPKQFSLK
ncbi:MAG: response regulator [Bacillales bacterium]|jgi:two-component system response regulator YesN|nr:response regulator [Bacillales bacterium]